MPKLDMSQVLYGIDGSDLKRADGTRICVYDGVIIWKLLDGSMINAWRGTGTRREEFIDTLIEEFELDAGQVV